MNNCRPPACWARVSTSCRMIRPRPAPLTSGCDGNPVQIVTVGCAGDPTEAGVSHDLCFFLPKKELIAGIGSSPKPVVDQLHGKVDLICGKETVGKQ